MKSCKLLVIYPGMYSLSYTIEASKLVSGKSMHQFYAEDGQLMSVFPIQYTIIESISNITPVGKKV